MLIAIVITRANTIYKYIFSFKNENESVKLININDKECNMQKFNKSNCKKYSSITVLQFTCSLGINLPINSAINIPIHDKKPSIWKTITNDVYEVTSEMLIDTTLNGILKY
jgi:hypothetical protein